MAVKKKRKKKDSSKRQLMQIGGVEEPRSKSPQEVLSPNITELRDDLTPDLVGW